MDLITHVIVGAATGAVIGQPVAGAIGGALPDLVLLTMARRPTPPTAYRCTHSALCWLALAGALCWAFGPAAPLLALLLGWLSHLLLDIPTHGNTWGPQLLFPLVQKPSYTSAKEWEWFNKSWFIGLALSVEWLLICLLIHLFL